MATDYASWTLSGMLKDVHDGKIQIPNFQREWVWDKNDVIDLLVSLLKDYPIGVFTVLTDSSRNPLFESNPLTNVNVSKKPYDGEKFLVLDGQQRITALYQTLYNRSAEVGNDSSGNAISNAVYVKTRGNKKKRLYFYLDIDKYVKGDIDEDVIVVADEDHFVEGRRVADVNGRMRRIQLNSSDDEVANNMFPLWIIFDSNSYSAWLTLYGEKGNMNNYLSLTQKLPKINAYPFHVFKLKEGTSKEAICGIFEKVNSTGVRLNVFDLLTASFAAHSYNLREKWNNVKEKFASSDYSRILNEITPDRFLMAVALVVTKSNGVAVSCKRGTLLDLDFDNFDKWYDKVADGYIGAAEILRNRCGIYSYNMIPYVAQLAPMAAIIATLENRIPDKNREKIVKWFWCAVFGERYDSSTDSRSAKDYVDVVKWIQDPGHPEPETVRRVPFDETKLSQVGNDSSALSKGVIALLLRGNVKDFYTGEDVVNIASNPSDNLEIHHIFPKEYCVKMGYKADKFDTIINMTPLSGRTNSWIHDKAPSKYLSEIDGKGALDSTNEMLKQHLIDVKSIRDNNFSDFYDKRKEALIKMINNVIT